MASWLSAYVQYNRKSDAGNKGHGGLTSTSITYAKDKPLDLWKLVVQIVVDIFTYAGQFTGMDYKEANLQLDKVRLALDEINFWPMENENAEANKLQPPKSV